MRCRLPTIGLYRSRTEAGWRASFVEPAGEGLRVAGAVVIAMLGLVLSGCDWNTTLGTTLYRVTIRVGGVDYTSEVVRPRYRAVIWGNYTDSPHGSVLTFRLPDDRVIVLGTTRWIWRLECVPRLDGTTSARCNGRWQTQNQDRAPDGYIYNSATRPTAVEAFQFEPRSPRFGPEGTYEIRSGLHIPASRLSVQLVSYEVKSVPGAKPKDTLDRDFPGYDHVYARDKTKNNQPINSELSRTASDLNIGPKRFR